MNRTQVLELLKQNAPYIYQQVMARQRKEQAEETRWEKANSPAPKISAPPLLKIPPTETESAESFEKFMKDEEEKRI